MRFPRKNIKHLNEEFQNSLDEQTDVYLSYIKIEGESNIGSFF